MRVPRILEYKKNGSKILIYLVPKNQNQNFRTKKSFGTNFKFRTKIKIYLTLININVVHVNQMKQGMKDTNDR